MQSNSLSVLQINLGNLQKNYKYIQKTVGKSVSVAPALKADAYGLGVSKIATSLKNAGCNEFYVATLDEGIELRKLISESKIFVLLGINKGEEYYFLKYHLTPVLNNKFQAEIWKECASGLKEKLDACIHVDIGMTRLGVPQEELSDLIEAISDSVNIEYILGHLSVSNEKKNTLNQKQLKEFLEIKAHYPQFKYSLANSGGVFLGKEYHFDQVRPGVGLYGTDSKNVKDLSPVITLTSEIINIFAYNEDVPVGYGCTYIAKAGTIVAAVPVGYADGYHRSLSNKGCCFIGDVKVPVIGRVNMDCMSLDITNVPKDMQKIGQKVELIGPNLDIASLADIAGTIDHEILTSLGDRYRREYI